MSLLALPFVVMGMAHVDVSLCSDDVALVGRYPDGSVVVVADFPVDDEFVHGDVAEFGFCQSGLLRDDLQAMETVLGKAYRYVRVRGIWHGCLLGSVVRVRAAAR